jgi:hypothetical protein
MTNEFLGTLGAVIAGIAALYYIYDIIWGETRPHRVTWAVWMVIGILGFSVTDAAGAGPGAYVAAVYVGAYVITFLLSLTPKYGKSGVRAMDIVLGVIAIAGVFLWRFGGMSDLWAAGLTLVCDAIALWPTLREAWLQPEHESLPAWSADVVGAALALSAVSTAAVAGNAYPVYLLAANTAIVAVLLSARYRESRVKDAMTGTAAAAGG